MTSFKEVEKWLARQGEALNFKKKYRLVWSTNATEKRKGIFNDFYGKIFLRTVKETRETLKYNYINKDRWILEIWSEGSNSEIDTSEGGSYEPLFVFEDSKGNYLDPTLKVVQFIIEAARTKVKLSPAERLALLEKAEDKEVQDFVDMLEGEGRSEIQSLLHTREAVSMFISSEGKKLTQRLFGGKK